MITVLLSLSDDCYSYPSFRLASNDLFFSSLWVISSCLFYPVGNIFIPKIFLYFILGCSLNNLKPLDPFESSF